MGFGSYDASEQQNREVSADGNENESAGVSVHEADHEGKVTFETDAPTDDLVGRLSESKDDPDNAEET